jgi:hypothetical protein
LLLVFTVFSFIAVGVEIRKQPGAQGQSSIQLSSALTLKEAKSSIAQDFFACYLYHLGSYYILEWSILMVFYISLSMQSFEPSFLT